MERRKVSRNRLYLLLDHLVDLEDKKGKVADMQSLLHIWNIMLLILALGNLTGSWRVFASFLTAENLCVVCLSAPPNCFWISQSILITLSEGGVKVLQILHSLTFKENRSQGKDMHPYKEKLQVDHNRIHTGEKNNQFYRGQYYLFSKSDPFKILNKQLKKKTRC